MNEPKSQTPLTDAARIDNADLSDWGTGKSEYVYADFARSLELKLQEAKQEIMMLSIDGANKDEQHGKQLQEAECQRDEAKDYAKRQEDFLQRAYACTCIHHNDKERSELICPVCLKAERDQLVKVVDALMHTTSHHASLNDHVQARESYYLLPHVQAKKGNQDK